MKSLDFKRLAIHQYHKLKSYRKAAQVMNVAHSSVYRWVNIEDIKPKKRKYVSKLFEQTQKHVTKMLACNPFMTWKDMSWKLETLGLKVSQKTIGKIIKRLGYTYKRAVHSTPCTWSKEKIHEFEHTLLQQLNDDQRVISIDECNFSEKTLPFRGYSKQGTKLITKLARPSWKAVSLLMAMSNKGECWYLIVNGSVSGFVFEEFIKTLPPCTLLLDNASIHRTVQNNHKMFIPPYSPQYNPIEMAFSKIKRCFRRLMQNRNSNTNTNILASINTLQRTDIIHMFEHVSRSLHIHKDI